MTGRNARALSAVAITLCLCALVFAQGREATAQRSLDEAAAQHARTLADARRLVELRAKAELVQERPRPQQDLVARLEAQLAAVGIEASSLSQVSLGASQPVAGAPYRRQTATVSIDNVSPSQAAQFLAAWSEAEAMWVVRAVRLRHAAQRGARDSDMERSFAAALTLENVHLDSGAATAAGSSL